MISTLLNIINRNSFLFRKPAEAAAWESDAVAQAARGVLTGGAWGSDAAGSGRCVGVTRSKSESESESDRASRVPGFPWRRGAIKPGRRSASPPRSVRFCSSVDSRHPDRSLLYFD